MRDKENATEFVRNIDTSHHSNIRVVMPPKIYHFLKDPDQVKFIIQGNRIVIEKVK